MSSITPPTTLTTQAATALLQQLEEAAAKQAATVPPAASAPTGDTHGPAVQLDLTAPAQSIADAQTLSPATAGTPATRAQPPSGQPAKPGDKNAAPLPPPPPPPPPPKSGGGGGATVSELTTDVEKVKREVAALVGAVTANQLVDSKGNIDQIGLVRAEAALKAAKEG